MKLRVLQSFVFLVVSTWQLTESLVCVCDDCVNSQTCEVAAGGRCYSQVLNFKNQPTQRRRRCYEPQYVDLCGTRTRWLVIECCDTDRCNENLLPLPTSSTSVATTSTSPQTTTTPEATVQPGGFQCIQFHSKSPEYRTTCTTTSGCYWAVRRRPSGEVVFKQGCSTPENPCVPEQRNRQDVFCCTSNLCNNVSAPSTPPPPCGTERGTTSQPRERTEESYITTSVPVHGSGEGERGAGNISGSGSTEKLFVTESVPAHESGGERGTGDTPDNNSTGTSKATKISQQSQLGRIGTGTPSEPSLHGSSNTGRTKPSSTASSTTPGMTVAGIQPSPSCPQLSPVSPPVVVTIVTVTTTIEVCSSPSPIRQQPCSMTVGPTNLKKATAEPIEHCVAVISVAAGGYLFLLIIYPLIICLCLRHGLLGHPRQRVQGLHNKTATKAPLSGDQVFDSTSLSTSTTV